MSIPLGSFTLRNAGHLTRGAPHSLLSQSAGMMQASRPIVASSKHSCFDRSQDGEASCRHRQPHRRLDAMERLER